MKKVLLCAAAFMAAMTMNAQEICTFNADNALGLDSENGTALTAGTVIGTTDNIVAKIGADDTYKPQSATFTVNGTDITGGLQGATNPKDGDGGVPATTLVQPASGAFLQFEAKADGFLYVMHKASSNKAYTVFEETTPISYTFAAIGDASTLLGGVYSYTLPYEVENEQFVVKNSVEWAEQEFLKATNPDAYAANWKEETADDGTTKKTWDPAIKVNGLGVIKFPVYKDCKYVVNANGSKITAIGFAFSTKDDVLIQSGDVVIYKGEGAAEPVQHVYSVIGTIVGNWDTDTDMQKGDGGLYTASLENIAAGNYEFKIRQDHDWAVNWGSDFKQDGPNCKVEVANDGSTINVSFKPATGEIAWEVVGGGEPGGPAIIAEVDWTQKSEWDGGWYSTDYAEVSVEQGTGLIINCTSDGTTNYWEPQVPMIGGIETIDEGGQYQVEFSFISPAAGEIRLDFYSWDGSGATMAQVFEVAEGENNLTIDFLDYPTPCTNAGIFYQCGKIPGKHIIKSVKVIDLETEAIQSVKAAQNDGAIYNLAGQKVNASYKGVVIKNGKKFLQK